MRILGNMDLCGPSLIEGWLYCDAWQDEEVRMQVYVGKELIGECIVDRFRADLQEAGFGDGRCGFSFSVPPQLELTSFADTRLRLVDSPIFMLPNEFTIFGVAVEQEPVTAESEAAEPVAPAPPVLEVVGPSVSEQDVAAPEERALAPVRARAR